MVEGHDDEVERCVDRWLRVFGVSEPAVRTRAIALARRHGVASDEPVRQLTLFAAYEWESAPVPEWREPRVEHRLDDFVDIAADHAELTGDALRHFIDRLCRRLDELLSTFRTGAYTPPPLWLSGLYLEALEDGVDQQSLDLASWNRCEPPTWPRIFAARTGLPDESTLRRFVLDAAGRDSDLSRFLWRGRSEVVSLRTLKGEPGSQRVDLLTFLYWRYAGLPGQPAQRVTAAQLAHELDRLDIRPTRNTATARLTADNIHVINNRANKTWAKLLHEEQAAGRLEDIDPAAIFCAPADFKRDALVRRQKGGQHGQG